MVESPARRALIFSASVGGGHDAAADALIESLGTVGFQARRIDYLDLLPAGLGRALKAAYATQLRHAPASWEWLCTGMHRLRPLTWLLVALTWLTARPVRRLLDEEPDLVVATYPMAGHAVGRYRRSGRLRCPLAVYLTDLSVHRLWIARGVDTYLAAHAHTAASARALGARDVRVAAPAVRAAFGDLTLGRDQARRALGLPAEGRLALVTAGAWAVGEVEAMVDDLHRTGLVRPVVLCAGDEALRRRFDGLPVDALGWVDRMPVLMRACDVLVSNAGGTTALEALTLGLPVTLYRCLPGHGRTNAAAFRDARLGRWVRSPDELAGGIRAALDAPAHLPAAPPAEALLTTLDPPARAATGSPARLRWAAAAVAVVAGAWSGTAGTEVAVAHGLREARPRAGVYLVVAAADTGPVDGRLLRTVRRTGAILAVDARLVRDWPGSVRSATRQGIPLANAGLGRPYQTGVLSGRTAPARTARSIRMATGRPPALLLSSDEVDAVDVGVAVWQGELILVPTNVTAPAAPVAPRPGETLLVSCGPATRCDLVDRLTQAARTVRAAGLPVARFRS